MTPHEREFASLVDALDSAQIKFDSIKGRMGKEPDYDQDFHKSIFLRPDDMGTYKIAADAYNVEKEELDEAAKEMANAIAALEQWMPFGAKKIMIERGVAVSVPMPGGHAFLQKTKDGYSIAKGKDESNARQNMDARRIRINGVR